nr:hypothetical protein [Salmonid herpesvirus 1]
MDYYSATTPESDDESLDIEVDEENIPIITTWTYCGFTINVPVILRLYRSMDELLEWVYSYSSQFPTINDEEVPDDIIIYAGGVLVANSADPNITHHWGGDPPYNDYTFYLHSPSQSEPYGWFQSEHVSLDEVLSTGMEPILAVYLDTIRCDKCNVTLDHLEDIDWVWENHLHGSTSPCPNLEARFGGQSGCDDAKLRFSTRPPYFLMLTAEQRLHSYGTPTQPSLQLEIKDCYFKRAYFGYFRPMPTDKTNCCAGCMRMVPLAKTNTFHTRQCKSYLLGHNTEMIYRYKMAKPQWS